MHYRQDTKNRRGKERKGRVTIVRPYKQDDRKIIAIIIKASMTGRS